MLPLHYVKYFHPTSLFFSFFPILPFFYFPYYVSSSILTSLCVLFPLNVPLSLSFFFFVI